MDETMVFSMSLWSGDISGEWVRITTILLRTCGIDVTFDAVFVGVAYETFNLFSMGGVECAVDVQNESG